MKVLKFGGRSLTFGNNFNQAIEIIKNKSKEGKIAVVVSAIGETTNYLGEMLESAKIQEDYIALLDDFKNLKHHQKVDLKQEFELLEKILDGVYILEDYSLKIKDLFLAQGEIIASKIIQHALVHQGIKALSIDSRQLFVTDDYFGKAQVDEKRSASKTNDFFHKLENGNIPIVTGFIGATAKGETTTLGRNGSNYSAALLADFIKASELENYTHVNGIYTANPDWVKDAVKIEELHYDEASELANFGASILHAKTIQPLLRHKIPLKIFNTLEPSKTGTCISSKPTAKGIKSLSLEQNVVLIKLEGKGLLGKIGIDARIFSALANKEISVGLISQGTSERGIGFTVKKEDTQSTLEILKKEFAPDIEKRDVEKISFREDIAIISIVGQELNTFDKPYQALIKNKITPILFSNSITGKNVSLMVKKQEAIKSLNVLHGQIFGVTKKLNLAIFGHGLVGGALIDQILEASDFIAKRKNVKLNIFAIANSKKVIFNANGIGFDWKEKLKEGKNYTIQNIVDFAEKNHLENLIAIDNTASVEFVSHYQNLVKEGFDLVSSNKNANTISYGFYSDLRKCLQENHKKYLYETNVGAGLPLIDTIQLLHLSGENITRIKGVFSGSLSYIFNVFSQSDLKFSEVLRNAVSKGFTEPDPREDLSGNDVGRKLLLLARELDLQNEFEEIQIDNLIPNSLRDFDVKTFFDNLEKLDPVFEKLKKDLPAQSVLRYVGELSGNLQESKAILETKLEVVSQNTPLGQLKGSDSIFEIYTESYGENPIIIQGAGAGASVTARGVLGDILRLAN